MIVAAHHRKVLRRTESGLQAHPPQIIRQKSSHVLSSKQRDKISKISKVLQCFLRLD